MGRILGGKEKSFLRQKLKLHLLHDKLIFYRIKNLISTFARNPIPLVEARRVKAELEDEKRNVKMVQTFPPRTTSSGLVMLKI